jgi:ArsR family transcriptional regulator
MYRSGASGTSQMPEPAQSWHDYTELKEMLKALGDNARLNITHALAAGGEVKVTELALRLAVSQPLVSWHLAILRRHGLVRTRRHGREVYCSLDLERFRRCQRLLSSVVEPPATGGPAGGQGPPQQERREPPAAQPPASEMATDGQAMRRANHAGL